MCSSARWGNFSLKSKRAFFSFSCNFSKLFLFSSILSLFIYAQSFYYIYSVLGTFAITHCNNHIQKFRNSKKKKKIFEKEKKNKKKKTVKFFICIWIILNGKCIEIVQKLLIQTVLQIGTYCNRCCCFLIYISTQCYSCVYLIPGIYWIY